MEREIAAILINFVRSIVAGASVVAVLTRLHVLRNAIILRMDWRVVHCPVTVANYMLAHLARESVPECRRLMAIVCDLTFAASLVGDDAFFTRALDASEAEDFRAPAVSLMPVGPF